MDTALKPCREARVTVAALLKANHVGSVVSCGTSIYLVTFSIPLYLMYILLETTTMTKAPPCPIVNPFEWSPKFLSKTWKVESYQPPLVHSQNLCLRLGKRLVAALCKSKEAHGGPVMDNKIRIRWFSYYCNGLPAQNGCYLREFQAIQACDMHLFCAMVLQNWCKFKLSITRHLFAQMRLQKHSNQPILHSLYCPYYIDF